MRLIGSLPDSKNVSDPWRPRDTGSPYQHPSNLAKSSVTYRYTFADKEGQQFRPIDPLTVSLICYIVIICTSECVLLLSEQSLNNVLSRLVCGERDVESFHETPSCRFVQFVGSVPSEKRNNSAMSQSQCTEQCNRCHHHHFAFLRIVEQNIFLGRV